MPRMAAEQPKARGGSRQRRRRVGSVCALLVVAWLAGRGFMAGGAAPDASAEPAPAGAAPPPHGTAEPPAMGEPTVAPAPQVEPGPAAPPTIAIADGGLEPDRFAALSAAVAVHAERGEVAAAAAAWRHVRALALSTLQREALEQAVGPARRLAADCLAASAAALAAGAAHSAVRALAPLRQVAVAGATALDLLPPDVAAAAALQLQVGLASDELLPAPKPLPRGRAITAWIDGAAARGVVVAADADAVTLQVRRGDGASFPMATYAACEPDAPTGAEAVELGLAAARQGDALLARAWWLVAMQRGEAAAPRALRLAAALR